MKRILLCCLLVCSQLVCIAESGNFFVGGDMDKYYPVLFRDGNWSSSIATELEIGRSAIHQDGDWHGSLIAKFRYHTFMWGNGAQFIDADIKTGLNGPVAINNFIAGWQDVTWNNGSACILIWLRGNTTYAFKSDIQVSPVVYDGIQNPLPFHEINGGDHTYKTSVDNYVNTAGATISNDLKVIGKIVTNTTINVNRPDSQTPNANINISSGDGHFFLFLSSAGPQNYNPIVKAGDHALIYTDGVEGTGGLVLAPWSAQTAGLRLDNNGNVGIGITAPTDKLAVNGNIRSKKVIVTQTGWPDYVFDSSYQLPTLDSVSNFIQTNKHLPDIPSAATVEKDGHDLGEVQKQLLKKVEEMTLYMIEQNKKIANQDKEIAELKQLLKNENKKK
ncbi:MAG: TMF family protein [Filimonas sp.]|nr:TMF family protein [Filimonas sp.]